MTVYMIRSINYSHLLEKRDIIFAIVLIMNGGRDDKEHHWGWCGFSFFFKDIASEQTLRDTVY